MKAIKFACENLFRGKNIKSSCNCVEVITWRLAMTSHANYLLVKRLSLKKLRRADIQADIQAGCFFSVVDTFYAP